MANEIISYLDMCNREDASLQRGMNYSLNGGHSVILMSLRPNAPYRDRLEDDGSTLIYEGHDHPRGPECPDPKVVDQLELTRSGRTTQNGRFYQAAHEYRAGKRSPEIVRVYEKIRQGIWSYNGVFELIDAWQESDDVRQVFKFKLIAVEDDHGVPIVREGVHPRRRVIPTSVKLVVWRRDGGRCVECGSTDELHFDHIVPFSKGGTSVRPENVQLLCARHNLQKTDNIQ